MEQVQRIRTIILDSHLLRTIAVTVHDVDVGILIKNCSKKWHNVQYNRVMNYSKAIFVHLVNIYLRFCGEEGYEDGVIGRVMISIPPTVIDGYQEIFPRHIGSVSSSYPVLASPSVCQPLHD